MLALHYYSNSESVRTALRQVAAAWWCQDDDPVYSKDLIKEFEMENPPLEDELAWILSKGIAMRLLRDHVESCQEYWFYRVHSIKFFMSYNFILSKYIDSVNSARLINIANRSTTITIKWSDTINITDTKYIVFENFLYIIALKNLEDSIILRSNQMRVDIHRMFLLVYFLERRCRIIGRLLEQCSNNRHSAVLVCF